MKTKNNKSKKPVTDSGNKNGDPKDYPWYPVEEDIYVQDLEETEIDPEDITQKKKPNAPANPSKKKIANIPEDELDVPGSELDDEAEEVGSEDEENNYYSIGGDDHDDLEENYD